VAAVVARGRILFLGGRAPQVASWTAVAEGPVDLAAVDALARMHLAARRAGGAVRVDAMCEQLRELLELVGLCRELEGKAEEGEEGPGVEEGVEPGDPVA
jgi:hypothetical protein